MTRSPFAGPEPWDLVAADYTADLSPHLGLYAADALAWAGVRVGERVVDVAAGPGTLALQAAALGASVEAVDVSPEMIAQLRAQAGTGVRVTVGDGTALPYADASFDAAFSMFGLMFFDDRARGLAELHRVLAPGGRALVSSWVPMSRVPAFAAAFGALLATVPELGPPPAAGPPLSDAASARAELTAAGFTDVEVREVVHASRFASTDDLWAMLARSSAPFAWAARRLGAARWSTAAPRIRAALIERLGPGPHEVVQPALLTRGVKA